MTTTAEIRRALLKTGLPAWAITESDDSATGVIGFHVEHDLLNEYVSDADYDAIIRKLPRSVTDKGVWFGPAA